MNKVNAKNIKAPKASWPTRGANWLVNGWTILAVLAIALVAASENAWAGSRLLIQAGQAWYEGVGIVGTLDLMMITAAFRMRRKGISDVQKRISRSAMWYGLGMSAGTNILSALVYKGIVDITLVGPWIVVAYSPVAVVTLWFVVEMLTHQSKSASQSMLPQVKRPKAHKPDSECTPAELARRQADRKRRADAKALRDLEALVNA